MPSSKKQSLSKQSPSKPTLIHEVENETVRHRIVIVSAEGTVDAGKWFADYELATHRQYFANLKSGSALPLGIFKVQGLPSQSLGY